MTLMRAARVLAILAWSLAILVAAGQALANRTPSERATPTGCAAYNPGAPFDLRVVPNRTWGIVPFEVEFTLAITSGSDSVITARWDFDGDGLADATGLETGCVFSEALSYEVVAEVETAASGLVTRSTTIEAHSALMSITFDDGNESVHRVAYPLLASRGIEGTAYVVTNWMNGGYYLSWDDLTELYEAGWDIGSHTLTHKDLTRVDSLTLDYELSESRTQLQAHGFPGRNFSVPFGACSWTVIRAAKRHYESCRGWKGLNPRLEETDPYLLFWDVTADWQPLSYYTHQIDSVATYGGWYILNNHIVYEHCNGTATCVSSQMLADVLDYALGHRVKILTVDQALASRSAPAAEKGLRIAPPRDRESLALAVEGTGGAALPVTVRFSAGRAGGRVSVYDVAGRMVKSLGSVRAGGHGTATWEGRSDDGGRVSAGCYFCVLETDDNRLIARKVMVVK
jgi:peptidoglycan/xylan/chitin deacetylase (PgdA/CDA1 family)